MSYKSASFMFYDRKTRSIFVGLEEHNKMYELRLFGGKIEKIDNNNSYSTAYRELQEESEGQIRFSQTYTRRVYVEKSKMFVYVKFVDDELLASLNTMQPTETMKELKWLHVSELDKLPKFLFNAVSLVVRKFRL